MSGTLTTDTGISFELTSGAKGGPPALPFPGRNWTIFKHVKAHAAQIMRVGDVSEAVLNISKAPYSCDAAAPRRLNLCFHLELAYMFTNRITTAYSLGNLTLRVILAEG